MTKHLTNLIALIPRIILGSSKRDKICTYPAKSFWLCLTLYDSMDCSLPGSSAHGILQARTLEWVAMPSPRGSLDPGIKLRLLSLPHWLVGSFSISTTWEAPKFVRVCVCVCVCVWLSRVWLFATPWTATCQASLSMEFPRQEYWSRLPFLSPKFVHKWPQNKKCFCGTNNHRTKIGKYLIIYK